MWHNIRFRCASCTGGEVNAYESFTKVTKSISRNPNPTIDAVRDFWNDHVHDWKVAKSPAGTKEFFEEIEVYRYEKLAYLPGLIKFENFEGQRVLDVGCGVGNDLSRFAKAGAHVVGIDLAPHSIELARNNFRYRNLDGEFSVMNGEALDFDDNSFDLAFCHTVLHFTPSPSKIISEIRRVIKPDGQAIIMTVNRRSWLSFMHRLLNVEIDHLDSPVFNTYTIREFEQMLAKFKQVRIVPERFPVRTKIHAGLKARLFNLLFVDLFNALPKSWIRRSGHHLIAFVEK